MPFVVSSPEFRILKPEFMNVRDALQFASEMFRAAGVSEERANASLLLEHILGVDRVALIARPERELGDLEERAFREAVSRRAAGEPVQYIGGVQEFYGFEFDVTPDVLIPRPETEHIVEVAIRAHEAAGAPPWRVLDVGTGSGCIAVTLAKLLPGARVAATDLSPAALRVASRNAGKLAAAVDFLCCDLASAVSGPFELVVSNPP